MDNKQKEVVIHKTEDYGIFKKLDGNRDFNKGLLQELHVSLENDGDYLKYNPILVNEKMEIVDGQHRLKVAEESQRPIYYIIAEGLRLKEAQLFNAKKRAWTSANYLDAYLTQGHRDAQVLQDFISEHNFSIAIGIKLLEYTTNHAVMKKFRGGGFEVNSLTKATDAASVLSTIREHSPDYAFSRNDCIRAVMIMLEILPDPKIFERKLTQYGTTITQRRSVKDYLAQFQLVIDQGGESGFTLK